MLGLVPPPKGFMQKQTFSYSCCQLPRPCIEPLLTHTSTGDPPTLAGSFGSTSCGVTDPFLGVLVQERFCLYLPRLESLFLPVLWKSCNRILLAFKVRFPRDFQSLCQVPRLWSLTWCSEPLQQRENCGSIFLQCVGHPPSGYGIWFYRDCSPPTVLLRLLLCLWMSGIFSWEVSESSCRWLFNSQLWFWCSCRRRWMHNLLLCHLELESLIIMDWFPWLPHQQASSLWPVGGTGRRLERLEEREIRVLLPCSIYALGMFSGSDCIPQGLCLLAGYYSMVPALTGLWGHYFFFLPFGTNSG